MAECFQHQACPPCPPRSGPTPLGQEEKQQEAGSPVLLRELAQAPVGSQPAPGSKTGVGVRERETVKSLFSLDWTLRG